MCWDLIPSELFGKIAFPGRFRGPFRFCSRRSYVHSSHVRILVAHSFRSDDYVHGRPGPRAGFDAGLSGSFARSCRGGDNACTTNSGSGLGDTDHIPAGHACGNLGTVRFRRTPN